MSCVKLSSLKIEAALKDDIRNIRSGPRNKQENKTRCD
jgi:hypothetical protein